MTRKKKNEPEETEQRNEGEVADNNDTKSQDNNKSENPDFEHHEKSEIREVKEMSPESGSESETNSDKEGRKEASAEEILADMQDKYLRLSAEFDNYRKRTLREKIELTKHAGENILTSIVPVMDDFERALKSMETSTDCNAMKNGIDLIYNKFRDFMKQNGIREIESLNTEFNVDLHEAVTKIPVQDEKMKGKVVEVITKGYYLHNKVIRFSKVVVGE
jgi:molecular chaperone GrpE